MGSRYFVHDITDTLKIVCVMIFYTVRHFYFLNPGDAKRSVWPITKVANEREVREVQEGATCFCDKKLSNYC